MSMQLDEEMNETEAFTCKVGICRWNLLLGFAFFLDILLVAGG